MRHFFTNNLSQLFHTGTLCRPANCVGARGRVRTHALMEEEEQETLSETVYPVEHHGKMFLILNINCI
jgi:hypothetical protein